jgi:hypothetical protein
MSSRSREMRSHLFTLRVWPEEVDSALVEWRGKVQHVPEGETLCFRDWNSMLEFLRETLGAPAAEQARPEEQ